MSFTKSYTYRAVQRHSASRRLFEAFGAASGIVERETVALQDGKRPGVALEVVEPIDAARGRCPQRGFRHAARHIPTGEGLKTGHGGAGQPCRSAWKCQRPLASVPASFQPSPKCQGW